MLYNAAAQDDGLASVIAVCTAALGPSTQLVGPPGSALEKAAMTSGLRFVGEGFCDRAYEPDGQLRSRASPGAILDNQVNRVRQAMDIVELGEVIAHTGDVLALPAETICLHGDSAGALETARLVHETLKQAAIEIAPPQ